MTSCLTGLPVLTAFGTVCNGPDEKGVCSLLLFLMQQSESIWGVWAD